MYFLLRSLAAVWFTLINLLSSSIIVVYTLPFQSPANSNNDVVISTSSQSHPQTAKLAYKRDINNETSITAEQQDDAVSASNDTSIAAEQHGDAASASNDTDDTGLNSLVEESGVDIAGILGIDPQHAQSSDGVAGLDWNILLGGQADPDLLEDIYDAVDTGVFSAELLSDIDSAIDGVVGDAMQHGRVSESTKEEIKYLIKFGYLDMCEALRVCDILDSIDLDRLLDKIPEKYFILAIRVFQQIWGLPITGQLNSNTKQLIDTDRCGNKDEELINKHTGDGTARRRKKRFVISRPWSKTLVHYKIMNYPFKGSIAEDEEQVRVELGRAFDVWSNISQLTIKSTRRSKITDIKVLFATYEHGDAYPFAGKRGVLAHAFYPDNGGLHFDEDEEFVREGEEGVSLFQTAVHEVGHALGFAHSEHYAAVMYPFYKPKEGSDVRLSFDDIAGLKVMYGERNDSELTDTDYEPPEESWSATDWCKKASHIDAAFADHRGYVYFFYDIWVMSVNASGMRDGFPKKISEEFPDIPEGRINAAFRLPALYQTAPCDAEGNCRRLVDQSWTYLFRDKKYFLYQDQTFVEEGVTSEKFVGIPPKPDMAYIMRDGKMYFLKSKLLFRVTRHVGDEKTYKVDPGFPQLFDNLYKSGMGKFASELSGALMLYSGLDKFYGFYFTKDLYFRYTGFKKQPDSSKSKDDGFFPRSWKKWFCRCGDNVEIIKGNSTSGEAVDMLEEVIMAGATVPDFVLNEKTGKVLPNIRKYEMVLNPAALSAASKHCYCVHLLTSLFLYILCIVLFQHGIFYV